MTLQPKNNYIFILYVCLDTVKDGLGVMGKQRGEAQIMNLEFYHGLLMASKRLQWGKASDENT